MSMLIQVSAVTRRAELFDVDDLTRFNVVVVGELSDDDLRAALAPLGRLESAEHAWIAIDRLKEASGRGNDEAWIIDFELMLSYATSKGWVDESGSELRAHLEHEQPA